LKSIQPGFDRVPLAEILAAVEWMAAQQSPRPGKVAIMGEGFGGFLALRAIQLHPETFSCAVAINAILNLNDEMNYLTQRQPTVASQAKASFLKQSASSFEESAIIRHPDVLTKPILFVLNPNNRASVSMVTQIIRTLYIGVDQTRTLYATMRNEGRDVDYFEIDRDFDRRDPAARANAYSKIEGFLAAHLYDFKVEVGEPKTVP
jgi:dipeptidyl aminopeptidase/acylaminoacyl peptidase